MAKKWAEVETSEQYQALSPEDKEAARTQYFNEVITPQVPKDEVEAAREQFMTQTGQAKPPVEEPDATEPKESWLEAIGSKIPGASAQIGKERGFGDILKAGGKQLLNVAGGIVEPAAKLATGIVSKPVSEAAGLAQVPLHATGLSEREPEDVKRRVQEQLTYEPRTELGKAEENPLNFLPEVISKGVGAVSDFAAKHPGLVNPLAAALPGDVNDPSTPKGMMSNAIREAIPQALSLMGVKGGKGVKTTEAALETQKKLAAPKDEIRDRVQKQGFVTPPEAGVGAQATKFFGEKKTTDKFSMQNEQTATRGVAEKVLGLEKDQPITGAALERKKREAYQAYDDLVAGISEKPVYDPATMTYKKTPSLEMKPKTAEAYQSEITKLEEKLASNPTAYAPLKPAIAMLKTEMGKATQSPKEAQSKISDFRREAKKTLNSPGVQPKDATVAHAKLFAADQLESLFAENLPQDSPLLQRFHDARKNLAQINVVEDALNRDGTINLERLGAIDEKRPGMLTGFLKDAADLANQFPRGAKTVSVPPSPFSYFDGILGGLAVTTGHAPAAAATAARGVLSTLIKPKMLQTKTPSYKVSKKKKAATAAARAAGVVSPSQAQKKDEQSYEMSDAFKGD